MKTYYPELNEETPACDIHAEYLYNSYKVTTPLELKGMGIKFQYNHPRNIEWNVYYVTTNAFTKLKTKYATSLELRFD